MPFFINFIALPEILLGLHIIKPYKKVKLKKLPYIQYTVYLYSMNDKYKENKPSGRPMAVRSFESVSQNVLLQSMWIDRLITSMYAILAGTIVTISLTVLFDLSG